MTDLTGMTTRYMRQQLAVLNRRAAVLRREMRPLATRYDALCVKMEKLEAKRKAFAEELRERGYGNG